MNKRLADKLGAGRTPDSRKGSRRDGDYAICTSFAIDEEEVKAIQRLSNTHLFSQRELALIFNVSVSTIGKIQSIVRRPTNKR